MFEIFNETNEEIKELKDVEYVLNKAIEIEKTGTVNFNVIIVDNEYIAEENGITYRTNVIVIVFELNATEKEINQIVNDIPGEIASKDLADINIYVISFALEDSEDIKYEDFRLLGDIYISIDKAKEQAIEYGHSFKREICFLAVHGLLHLLGYDHMVKEEEKIMFSKQELILNEAGITK